MAVRDTPILDTPTPTPLLPIQKSDSQKRPE